MNRPFLARLMMTALFCSVAAGGIAHAAPQNPPPPGAQSPRPAKAPPATREEALTRADRMFDRLDADRDGKITQAELTAARQARIERREAAGKPVRQRAGEAPGGRMFAHLDQNRDGAISRDEFRATAMRRFERVDSNADGRIDAAEAQSMRDRRMSGPSPSADRR
jgi:hypothetical protein